MFQINKQEFGAFLAELRKEKGMLQKELAQKLLISDKAVSKWETGSSMPDVTLLVPLAGILGVTVTELLECHRAEPDSARASGEVEVLVQKALTLSEEERQRLRPRKCGRAILYGVCLMIACMEIALLFALGYTTQQLTDHLLTIELLCAIFGSYFCLFAREEIPAFYDQNKLNFYSDGIFRMNIPGVSFNNSNWPHIIGAGRVWALLTLVGYPLLYLVATKLIPTLWPLIYTPLTLILLLGGLFIPIYVVAKKYE